MCGICGVKGLSSKDNNIYLDDMLKSLSHRGPDEEGKYLEEDLFLGIKRLSIIDLITGSQRLYNEEKSVVLICNGEIYNFNKLKESLIAKGHKFRSHTDDIEVIIHLYEDLGTDCLKELKGMFAFVIWDKKKKILFAARDRLGIKPFYYFSDNGIFAFASEIKSLLKLPFISKELEPKAVDLYFSLEYIPAPLSIFKGIFKLKPGHLLIYKDCLVSTKSYWSLDELKNTKNISLPEASEELERLLEESVKEHLLSDVPLGVFLSGGIDSSTLTALASRLSSNRFNTCSIGFLDKGFDESRYAKQISHYFNTRHHHYIFTINDFINIFPEVVRMIDEPFGDLSIFPTYLLCKLSHQFMKVALSGEGADELFMGYPTYRAHRYMAPYRLLPQVLRRHIITPLINCLPVSFEYFSLDFKLKQFLKGQFLNNSYLRHLFWMDAFTGADKESLYNENFRQKKSNTLLESYVESLFGGKKINNPLKAIQYLDIFSYLSDDLLMKADRARMVSSLEIRLPYLDHQLIEFVWSLPSELIFQKRLLKDVMNKSLPSSSLQRSKKGFAIPFSKWITDKDFFVLVENLFAPDFICQQKIFNYFYIKKLLDDHLAKKIDNRKKLGTYIMFQAWYNNYFS